MIRKILNFLARRTAQHRARFKAQRVFCPSRITVKIGRNGKGLDYWERGWMMPEDRPPLEWGAWRPRVCSFCQSIHPADARALIEKGWEAQGTEKFYKKFLTPPGYVDHIRGILGSRRIQPVRFFFPKPAVQLKAYHFDNEERNLFNNALKNQAEKAEKMEK